jgi:alanyl-tRNA synthetase
MQRTIKISVTVNAETEEQVQQIADHCKAVVHALIDGQPIVYRNNQGRTVHINDPGSDTA